MDNIDDNLREFIRPLDSIEIINSYSDCVIITLLSNSTVVNSEYLVIGVSTSPCSLMLFFDYG